MLLAAALLLAQSAPCATTIDAALPAPLAGWTAPGETLAPGKAASADAPGGTVTLAFRVEKAGRYGVALDQKGWIDVLPEGATAPLVSVAHREGDPCWSIRKIVSFALVPGAYRLTLTKLIQPRAKVMLVEEPPVPVAN